MNKTARIVFAMLMGVALVFAVGCQKDDGEEQHQSTPSGNGDNGGGNGGNGGGDNGGNGGGDTLTEGVLPGEFSVSRGKTVHFSQGNLQYQASTQTWRFSAKQYICIGDSNSNISSTYSGWIDLFAWGTSGWNSGATCYQPWSTSTSDADYAFSTNMTGAYDSADWGVYNAIQNGGNAPGRWRTLTGTEWNYLLYTRTDAASKAGYATVAGVTGVILLPDSFADPMKNNGSRAFAPKATTGWDANVYTAEDWAAMEAAGAVFLPAAGGRYNTRVLNVGTNGYYWSSAYSQGDNAGFVHFESTDIDMNCHNLNNGRSVRLVKD